MTFAPKSVERSVLLTLVQPGVGCLGDLDLGGDGSLRVSFFNVEGCDGEVFSSWGEWVCVRLLAHAMPFKV